MPFDFEQMLDEIADRVLEKLTARLGSGTAASTVTVTRKRAGSKGAARTSNSRAASWICPVAILAARIDSKGRDSHFSAMNTSSFQRRRRQRALTAWKEKAAE